MFLAQCSVIGEGVRRICLVIENMYQGSHGVSQLAARARSRHPPTLFPKPFRARNLYHPLLLHGGCLGGVSWRSAVNFVRIWTVSLTAWTWLKVIGCANPTMGVNYLGEQPSNNGCWWFVMIGPLMVVWLWSMMWWNVWVLWYSLINHITHHWKINDHLYVYPKQLTWPLVNPFFKMFFRWLIITSSTFQIFKQ